MRIRPVEAAHVGDLIRIAEETRLSPWTASCYLDEMKNPDSILLRLVAEDNSTVGFVVGRFVTSSEIESSVDAEIYNIAVSETLQKKGFGQLLFNAFAAACHKKRARKIWLEVRESNYKAIAFYEKNGFSRVHTRNHFYNNPREHAILMRLDLKV